MVINHAWPRAPGGRVGGILKMRRPARMLALCRCPGPWLSQALTLDSAGLAQLRGCISTRMRAGETGLIEPPPWRLIGHPISWADRGRAGWSMFCLGTRG